MKKVLTAIGVMALITFVSIVFFGVSTLSKGKAYAPRIEAAVDRFYHLLDSDEYAAVYRDLAGEKFRDAATLEEFSAMMYNVRSRLGAVHGREKGTWKVFAGTGGTHYFIQYNVHRANADAVEMFTFKKEGDVWRLVGYNVNSPELLK